MGLPSDRPAAWWADQFPRVSIGAGLGLVAGTLSGLGSTAAVAASLTPGFTWRALAFGRLDADIAHTQGTRREALVCYRQTVTTAFAEADTALFDLRWRAQARERAEQALQALTVAWESATLQYRRGLIDFTRVIDVQRELNRLRDGLALTEQAGALAAVQAYASAGGGWSESTP